LAALLFVSFGITVGSFVASSWISDHRAHGLLHAAENITTDAVPAIGHLAGARTALRRMELVVEAEVHQEGARGGGEPAIREARARLASEWNAYRRFPPFPGERDRWPDVDREITAMDSSVDRILVRIHAQDWASAKQILRSQAEPAFDRVDDQVQRLLEVNTGSAVALGTRVMSLRQASRHWMLVLDAVSAFFAVIAALSAIRLVRQYARLMEYRLLELEHFAGRVAHDIRSPLASVGLALTIAERAPQLEPKLQSILTRGTRTLQRVGQVIDGLLVFARAGAIPPEGAHADVKEVIRGVIEDIAPVAREKEIDLEVAECPLAEVACSTGVLTSLLSNLVTNAVKYMGGAPIRRIALRARDNRDSVRVEVEDTGPGIAPELRARVFDPYVRGAEAGIPGLGLGLATVRRLVEAHGGSVGLESHQGSGCLFWLDLPKALTMRQFAPV
jgi:signal transduction histidine kinase